MKEVAEGKRRIGVDFLTLILMFGIIFILSYLQGRSMGPARLRAPAAAPPHSLQPRWLKPGFPILHPQHLACLRTRLLTFPEDVSKLVPREF